MLRLTLFLLGAAAPAAAQPAHNHSAHDQMAPTGAASAALKKDLAEDAAVKPDKAAAAREMEAINARMHKAMELPLTGNLDADFVRSMIPHHQGAIDLAEVTLKNSSDPQIRTLARNIVGAQRREIAFMRSWLRERGIAEK